MTYRILQGDCMERLLDIPEGSVDAVVTDPPYGLGFMNKDWDIGVPSAELFRLCLHAMKPGAHLLAFGGSRTYHRLAVAVEDAGFEIRDQIMWLYGSGFPKSRNIGKEAPGWEGWGTALKPAHEPIVVARKPLIGTVAANVLERGTGALNIDGCRVPMDGETTVRPESLLTSKGVKGGGYGQTTGRPATGRVAGSDQGRWPANLIHDGSDEVLGAFPEAKGQQGALTGKEPSGKMGRANCYGVMDRRHEAVPRIESDTNAARFFYCAKASRQDRNEGCDGLEEHPLQWSSGNQNPGSFQSEGTKKAARNHHPTVKPTELMRYLCRLVTPPGGTVLDPFMGSGSTGKAAVLEEFAFIGIEIDPGYAEIADRRIRYAMEVLRDRQLDLLGNAS